MKKAKFWYRASLIVSSMLVVFGAYFILIYGSLMDGLVHIGLGLIVGIDSWVKLFKKKK